MTAYEAVIGVEVHAELKTKTKAFCACSTAFGQAPNTACCPVCMGLPGALPVLNREAVRLAVLAGTALHCRIRPVSHFDRKNYFYPDLPKGYQITQDQEPLCYDGYVDIPAPEGEVSAKRIPIRRLHLEEDAGKLLHCESETHIDYNRCGVPLIEIVTEPVLRSGMEVKAYLTALRQILVFAGVSDGKMNEGSMRCEINVSVRPAGSSENGTRCEVKNIGSIQFAARAAEEEAARQIRLLSAGGQVAQETRRFDERLGTTVHMRRKESSEEYRYLPEPNLPPLYLSQPYIQSVQKQLPKMPWEWQRVFADTYRLSMEGEEGAMVLRAPENAAYFSRVAAQTAYPGVAMHLFVGEIAPQPPTDWIEASWLAETADLLGSAEVSNIAAKELLHLARQEKRSPREIAEREHLLKIRDADAILPYVRAAVAANPKAVADYRNGKKSAAQAILGHVMRTTRGRADPSVAMRLLSSCLDTDFALSE